MLGQQVMKQFHIVHYTRLYVFYQLILVLARYLYRFGGDGSPVSQFRNQSYFEPSRTILTLRTQTEIKNVQILLKTCIPYVGIKYLIQSLRSFQYYLTIFFFLIFPLFLFPICFIIIIFFGYPEFHSGMPLREAFLLVVVVPTLLENFKNDNKRYTLKRSTLVTIGTVRLLFQCSPFQCYKLKRTTLVTIVYEMSDEISFK